jgi:hypothetical protein
MRIVGEALRHLKTICNDRKSFGSEITYRVFMNITVIITFHVIRLIFSFPVNVALCKA